MCRAWRPTVHWHQWLLREAMGLPQPGPGLSLELGGGTIAPFTQKGLLCARCLLDRVPQCRGTPPQPANGWQEGISLPQGAAA